MIKNNAPITPLMLWQARDSDTLFRLDQYDKVKVPLNKLHQLLTDLREQQARAFDQCYVKMLAIQGKTGKITTIKVGDKLLFPDGVSNRKCFTLGIVEQIYPGIDGIIRVVKIRTAKGSFIRAVKGSVMLEAV